MNKSELVQIIALRAGIDQSFAREITNMLLDTITESLANGEAVAITGFGRFDVRDRQARNARNPRTGEVMTLPATRLPRFRAGKKLKEAVTS